MMTFGLTGVADPAGNAMKSALLGTALAVCAERPISKTNSNEIRDIRIEIEFV
jgi:hypothetical protein